MANEVIGNASVVKVDTLAGGVYNTVANQLNATLSLESDLPEATNKSSSQNKTYLQGNTGWSCTVDGQIDGQAAGDTDGFIVIQTAWTNKVALDFQFAETGTADTYTGTVFVESISRSYPQNDTATYTASLRGSGALTPA